MAARLRMRREMRDGTQLGFMEWALLVPEPKAGRLDFKRFPFQVELYSAGVNDEEAVVKKSTQVGMSAWGVRWALYHADTKGMTGLYLFPTARDMWDFSTLRVGPVIRNSPHLRSRQKPDDPNNKGMKGIGLGTVVFRGSEAISGLESIDADHMVFDEYDLLEKDNLPAAERRTGASQYAYKRRLGWPSVPMYGIDRLYEESDQRTWMVRCECGEWQDLDFFRNVDQASGKRVCRQPDCRRELDVGKGQWVAKFTDSDRPRGYHVTQMLVPGKSMRDLIKASKGRTPAQRQSFMNRDLGLAWAPEEGRLSDAAYAAAVAAGGGYGAATSIHEIVASAGGLRTMGVDVATTRNINIRVSEHTDDGRKRALFIGEVGSFTEVEEVWQRFGPTMGAVDHLPEGRLARAWAERHPGQIYLVALTDSGGAGKKEPWNVDDELLFASVNRTVALDAMFEQIRAQQNMLPVNAPEGYKDQLQAPNRLTITDETGIVGKKAQMTPKGLRVFYRSSGPDDYAMAEVFDVCATELHWRRVLVDEAQRESFSVLDDELDFERSHLSDLASEPDYYAGGIEGDYHPGGRDG